MDNNVKSFIPRQSDRITTHRKEKNGLVGEYALIDLDTGSVPVTLRIYWPESVAYACVWIHHGDTHARGAGKAGGGGYCKESAAAHNALSDAGIVLENPIDGRGTQAIDGALEAVARHLGIARFIVHKAHP